MNPSKRANWKTLEELFAFCTTIREANVQGTELGDLLYPNIAKADYDEFMSLVREQDRLHHGVSTF